MNRRDNVACGLAGEIVRNFGKLRLRALGTSMMPAIFPGDLISVQKAEVCEISRGEIVLWTRDGRLFIHRVAAHAGDSVRPLLITRGDRLGYNDPPVSSAELLGRVISVERNGEELGNVRALQAGRSRALARIFRASDRATHLYVRLAAFWRSRSFRRASCQV